MSSVSEGPLAAMWTRSSPRAAERELEYERPLRVACGTLRRSSAGLVPGVSVLLHAEDWEEVEQISDRAHDLAEEYGLVAAVVPYDRHVKIRFSRAAGSDPTEVPR